MTRWLLPSGQWQRSMRQKVITTGDMVCWQPTGCVPLRRTVVFCTHSPRRLAVNPRHTIQLVHHPNWCLLHLRLCCNSIDFDEPNVVLATVSMTTLTTMRRRAATFGHHKCRERLRTYLMLLSSRVLKKLGPLHQKVLQWHRLKSMPTKWRRQISHIEFTTHTAQAHN